MILVLAWGLPSILQATERDAPVGALLKNHCVRCHNAKMKKGGVDLANLATDKDLAKHRKLIRRLLEQIEAQSMPPSPEPALAEDKRDQLLRWARQALVLSEAKDPADRNPGAAPIRRLNRNEYNRTLRDLVGLDFDVAAAVGMVEDTTSHSFDNIADGADRVAGVDGEILRRRRPAAGTTLQGTSGRCEEESGAQENP
jgi:hypothetical protein